MVYFMGVYGKPDFSDNLDELMAHLYATTKSDLICLPPTDDAFILHAKRSMHQIIIYKNAHSPCPVYPDATHLGREIIDGKLAPVLMIKAANPQEATSPKICKCKANKCMMRLCICAQKVVECIVACLCGCNPERCGWNKIMIDETE